MLLRFFITLERFFSALQRFLVLPHELLVGPGPQHLETLKGSFSQSRGAHLPGTAANYLNLDSALGGSLAEQALQFANTVYAAPIERHDYVVLFKSCLGGRTVSDYFHHNRPALFFEPEILQPLGGDFFKINA